MKIAFLFDVHVERMDEFRQRIEDVVNSVDGRLIFDVQSRFPIRLVCAEDVKKAPAYTGSPSVRVVKNGSNGNSAGDFSTRRRRRDGAGDGRWALDGANHRGDCPFDCRCRAYADVGFLLGGLQRHRPDNRPGPRSFGPGSDWRSDPLGFRLRVPSVPTARVDEPFRGSEEIPGQPIFMGA